MKENLEFVNKVIDHKEAGYHINEYKLYRGNKWVGVIENSLFHDNIRGVNDECQITYLYVKKEEQGKGYGKMLVDYFEKQKKNQCDIIQVASYQSSEFYKHIGFKKAGGILNKWWNSLNEYSTHYRPISK